MLETLKNTITVKIAVGFFGFWVIQEVGRVCLSKFDSLKNHWLIETNATAIVNKKFVNRTVSFENELVPLNGRILSVRFLWFCYHTKSVKFNKARHGTPAQWGTVKYYWMLVLWRSCHWRLVNVPWFLIMLTFLYISHFSAWPLTRKSWPFPGIWHWSGKSRGN